MGSRLPSHDETSEGREFLDYVRFAVGIVAFVFGLLLAFFGILLIVATAGVPPIDMWIGVIGLLSLAVSLVLWGFDQVYDFERWHSQIYEAASPPIEWVSERLASIHEYLAMVIVVLVKVALVIAFISSIL